MTPTLRPEVVTANDNSKWQQQRAPGSANSKLAALDRTATVQLSPCFALLKQLREDTHLGEHALLVQQRQDAHTLGRARFNQVNALLIVLELDQSPVHALSSIHLLLQLEQMPALCQYTLV